MEEIFYQIAEQSTECWLLYDLSKKKIEYISPAFSKIWEDSPDSFKEDPISLLNTVHPEDRQYVESNCENFLKEYTKMRLDFRILQPENKHKWIALKAYPISKGDKVTTVAIFAEDDTVRKENLLHMQTVIGKKNASLEVVSHDLRGPFGLVESITTLIEKQCSSTNDTVSEYTELIKKICKRSLNLIRSMIDSEFLQSPEVAVDKERLDLVAEVKSVVETYQSSQEEISRKFEITSNAPSIYAEVDSSKFVSILNNLISNAIKFTRDNGVIKVHLEEKPNLVMVEVTDNGIGIPEKLQSKIFDPFTKARRPGLKGEDTVGLGMSIIKRLVEMHEGKIWVESKENKGTTFFLEFPKVRISKSTL